MPNADVPARKYALAWNALDHYPRLERQNQHPTRWEFPAYLDNPGSAWLRTLRELYETPGAFPASISPEGGMLLFALVRNIRPRTVIEVGSFLGVSTIWIAAALASNQEDAPGAVVHTVDDFSPMKKGPWRPQGVEQDREPLVADAVRRAGLEAHVRLHRGISWDVIPGLDLSAGVQLALLDGDHTQAGVSRDLAAIEPRLCTGGFLILHDTNPDQCGGCMGPRLLVERINSIAQGLYETCELPLAPLNYGMALARRVG